MKKVLFASLVLVLFSAFSAYAGPISLTADDLIGTITPGLPAGTADEEGYATQLITMYNTGSPTSPFDDGDNVFTLDAGSNVPSAPLPAIISFDDKIDGPGPYEITGSYLYALLKFGNATSGQRSELYYLNGQTGTIDMGGSLSHVRLFNPTTTVPEPSLILLLGLGLGAVGLVPRRKK